MAERRMFTMKIIDSDAFLDMPLSTQALYFHLNMRADDDGFVNNPKKIQRMIGCCDDDLKLLIAKRFILTFENGVIVIKHWRMHNLIRKDRYNPTQYQEQMAIIDLKDNGSYTEKEIEIPQIESMATTWQPDGNQMATQDRLGKDSIGKDSEEEDSKGKSETFVSVIADYTKNEELISSLKDYIEMRKKTKGFTIRALKLNLTTLDTLASDEAEKIVIVNKSVEHSWKGFYPLNKSNSVNNSGVRKAVLPKTFDYNFKNEEIPEKPDIPADELLKGKYEWYKSLARLEGMTDELQQKIDNVKLMYKDLTGKELC